MRAAPFLIAVACLAAIPAGAAEPRYSRTYSTCMDRSGGVTAAMVDCIGAEFTAQDRRLNASYRKALANLPKPRRAALTRAQRAWIAFKDAECAFVLDPDGGTLARVSANDCVLRMTATRADELEAVAADAAAR